MSNQETTPTTPVNPVNTEAYKNLRLLVREYIKETEDNPKTAKSHGRFTAIFEGLGEIRDLINEKTAKIKALNAKNAELREEISQLQAIVDAEPTQQVFEIRRLVSAFSGVKDVSDSTPIDQYNVTSNPEHLITRIKPLTDVEAGVVALKVFVTDTFAHVIPMSKLIGVYEAREGRRFNIDADSQDALLVYSEAMSIAIEIADIYTKRLGAFSSIPLEAHLNEEAELVPSFYRETSGLVTEASDDDAEDSDEEDSEDDADADTDTDIDADEIARRLAAEDDDVDSEEGEEGPKE